ncbi:MAG: sigma-70 family RNA polymerase sigma factor [Actinomycetota bacterium]|jgi:RNA polymerase sigma-70 factor (ECF subfamily)|nr:sigma-70 family RNA polymerase sigma factor [Actinomycetota bacterium]
MALGDEAAGVAFVRRYQRRAFGLALSILGDPGQAEDVAQEALVRAWRHAPVYDSRRGSVTTWLLTITRNLAIDALRMRVAVPIDPDDIVNLGVICDDATPEDHAERGDVAERARKALACVPTEQRRALVLSSFYGLTAQEIATQEDIPLGTAKTRIRAGLAKVRSSLAAEGQYDGALVAPRSSRAARRSEVLDESTVRDHAI